MKAQPQRLLVYRSYPLDRRNDRIVRALVMVHGGLRLAADQFTNELAAAFLSEALGDTLLVAPRFASNTTAECADVLAAQEANWICEDARADSWRNGSPVIGNPQLTSFDFADEIVRRLADRKVFPNLKHIVVAGHSGGGQYTLRGSFLPHRTTRSRRSAMRATALRSTNGNTASAIALAIPHR